MSARTGLLIAAVSISVVLMLAYRSAVELHKYRSDDPTVWENEIAAFEREDRRSPPPRGAVLFLGSSGIRAWRTIAEDLAPLVPLPRGFGGAKTDDILHHLDRIAVPYEPRAVVLYAGGNDLFERAGNTARTPEDALAKCREIVEALAVALPGTPVYFIELRPPILDAQQRDPFSKLNALLGELARDSAAVGFIEANAELYDETGRIREGYLSGDRVHLTREGYRVWSEPIRARLLRDLEGAPARS